MQSKNLAVWIALTLCSLPAMAQDGAANPLQRHYRDGETLAYRMTGINEQWHYTLRAEGGVKCESGSRCFEEYHWTSMQSGGKPVELRADMADFTQKLTLDPDVIPAVPDLTKVDPKLIGPITDLMTFYSDLWLANKLGQLKKPGDHFYFRNPMPPSSWADGSHTLVGESAIDFDMSLKAVDPQAGTALLEVRHVPPETSPLHVVADWMKNPVGDGPNNWEAESRNNDGTFQGSVGQETFVVEITVDTSSGKILRASMDNLVKTKERTCKDRALTDCGAIKPHSIQRKIELAAVERVAR